MILDVWKSIQSELIPRLVSNEKPLRIWHNACSSGEEVYSFLILAIEAGIDTQLEIFATDINTNCLKIAASGIYALKQMEKYNESYLKSGGKKSLFDYGQALGDHYFQFHDSLRSKIKFSYLDIIKDPGIPNCDLIFSRNVLIYFMMTLQECMVSKLFNCMNTKAYLCLGNNENLSWTSDFKHMTFPF